MILVAQARYPMSVYSHFPLTVQRSSSQETDDAQQRLLYHHRRRSDGRGKRQLTLIRCCSFNIILTHLSISQVLGGMTNQGTQTEYAAMLLSMISGFCLFSRAQIWQMHVRVPDQTIRCNEKRACSISRPPVLTVIGATQASNVSQYLLSSYHEFANWMACFQLQSCMYSYFP